MGKKIKKLILLSYIDRSGSTLLMSRLNCVKGYFAVPECELLFDVLHRGFYDEFKEELLNDYKFSAYGITEDAVTDLLHNASSPAEFFLSVLQIYKDVYCPDCDVVVFKRQMLLSYYAELSGLKELVELKIVSLYRHPCGIYNSMLNNKSVFEPSLFDFIKLWNSHVFLSEKYADYVIKYEQFLKDGIKEVLTVEKLDNGEECIKQFFDRLSDRDKALHSYILKEEDISRGNLWKKQLSGLLSLIMLIGTKRKRKIAGYL